ncbi:hypothetical protein FI667_g14212, partial [Globisporangium splendens]
METNELQDAGARSAVSGAMAAIRMSHLVPVELGDSIVVPGDQCAIALAEDDGDERSKRCDHATGSGRGRRRAHGQGRKRKLSVRTPVTFAHKLDVIEYFDAANKDMSATMRQFYAHLSPRATASRKRQIYKWVKDRDAIETMCFKKCTAGQTRRRDKGTATTLSAEAESELVAWILSFQSSHDGVEAAQQALEHEENGACEPPLNAPLSMQMFRDKAMEIADRYGVPSGSFQATWTWQQAFFKRHNLTSL